MATWFITGASAGIGRAVAEQLLKAGHRVAATARDENRLEVLRRQGGELWTTTLDVTDTRAVRDVVGRAFADLGRIDVIFSNAGRGAVGAAEELSDEAIAEQIAVNLTGPIQLIRAALPHLRAQGGGRIIQTTTMGAQISSPGASLYHASKWGIEGFLESLVPEVAPFGIGVTMIEPGSVRTDFGAALSIADPLPAYAATPAGRLHRYIKAGGGNLTADAPGDPARVAAAIITAATTTPAPRRLTLGSDAHAAVQAALTGRQAELDKALAASTDFPS
ncbi:SDR family oxidoreductase [Actinoplanes sp. TRM 88003]|uniref:SDR family oxidoreductase n=1 Tax=Paractinoplanes aksuensis TaxID=2939490 RepID=A0ABT1DEL2_9ACTN|nr:SDR family oxidoreductase [Actinoplanes aksuensis]MCO8269234.1 SDR family oxidoreductase [Actinoplanes aksuensis]